MHQRRPLSTAAIAVLAAALPISLASSADAAAAYKTVTAKAYACSSWSYAPKKGFSCTYRYYKTVTARVYTDGSVYVKNAAGTWVKVDYRYSATAKALYMKDPAPTKAATTNMGHATSYAYMFSGSRVAATYWERCTPIIWKADFTALNKRGGNATAELTRLKSAFSALSAASGYQFTYKGTAVAADGEDKHGSHTGEGPSGMFKAATGADITVSYSSTHVTGYNWKELANSSTIGLGGVSAMPSYTTNGEVAGRHMDGFAVLDADFVHANEVAPDPTRSKGVDESKALYLHELGHALGLDHITDRYQIMHPGLQKDVPARLGAGDIAGLKKLAAQPCFAPDSDEDPAANRLVHNLPVGTTTVPGLETRRRPLASAFSR
ncbi:MULTISPECIES: matrixin family metalloprotease [unclassified Streptomyces]|uniref:matrixin family metalloprotease n=1 Tax=unclassified Streptomyces TaxID=2593676 RepID=UPI00341BF6D6